MSYQIIIASLDQDDAGTATLRIDPSKYRPAQLKRNLEQYWAWDLAASWCSVTNPRFAADGPTVFIEYA